MINLELGSSQAPDGRSGILTRKRVRGFAVYGPYERLQPGAYAVELTMAAADAIAPRDDTLVAVVDVACDVGRHVLARREIRASELADGRRSFTLEFHVAALCRAEYRVWVNGKVALQVEDCHRAVTLTGEGLSTAALVESARFPEEAGAALPFFVQHRTVLLSLFERGVGVRIVDGEVRLMVGGIVIRARCEDDLALLGELLIENPYNFGGDTPVCAIDVGMNIGVATLQFAAKKQVRQVHAFEPFRATYDRAMANILLNPEISAKITPHCVGLSDKDTNGVILVAEHGVSGAMTTVGVHGGVPAAIALRDAGAMLRPIIEDAVAEGLDVFLKVDCEGSEFAIFESLAHAGLLGKIRAFMVEWHAMFEEKTQETLLAPLRAAGFVVFDRSAPVGNGFFYAVRV